jgi:hypothetical protein
MSINNSGKTAYIYNNGVWYALAGSANTAVNYSWDGAHDFNNVVTANDAIKAKGGVNNFASPSDRDAKLPNPIRGLVCFIGNNEDSVRVDQLQYYNGSSWQNISGYKTIAPKVSSYVLTAADNNRVITVDSSNPTIITIPANSTTAIPVGYTVDVIQLGSGSTTIAGESIAVAIKSKSNILSLDGQFSKGSLVKLDTNTWFFFGNLLSVVVPTPTPTTPTVPTPTTPTVPTPTTPTVPTPTVPTPTPIVPTPTPYPNISNVVPYGAGPGQAWTADAAYISWGGSGWGSYKVEPNNGATAVNEPTSSSANFPVLLTGLAASTNYSVTVTLYAGANYTGASASSTGSFSTASSATPTPTPTPSLPTLSTPTLSSYVGWETYPNSMYANITVTNFDQTYSTTYSSSMGTQNPEFPEEFNLSGLTPNQSYTVYVTASKSGYTNSTGSITFTAVIPTPTPAPTPTVPTPTISQPYTYEYLYYDGACRYAVKDVSGSTVRTYSTNLCSNTGTDESGATLPSCNNPSCSGAPAPTPTVPTPTPTVPTPTNLTTYYGCCTNGQGVSDGFATQQAAVNGLNTLCSDEPGVYLSGGVYTTPQSCNSVPTPTPIVPTPTVSASFGITGSSVTQNSATFSWANAPSGTAWYNVSRTGLGESTVTGTSHTFDSLSAGTSYTLTVTAKGTSNQTLGTDSTSVTTSAATPTPTVTPTTPTVTPTTPTVTYPTLLSGWHLCAPGDAPNPSSPCVSSDAGVRCVNGTASGASCPDPNAPTPTVPTPTVTDSWYCTTAYYQSQIPNDTYMSPTNDTGYACANYNTVCRQTPASFPTASRPTACSPTPTVPTPTVPTPTVPTPTVPTPTTYPALLSGWHYCTSQDVANPASTCTGVNQCKQNNASGESCPDPNSPTPTVPTPTVPTPTVSTTYCPSLGYPVATSGYPGNCPGASPTPTVPTPTSSNKTCSQSDYANIPYPNCMSVGACDPLGSLVSC